MAAVSVMEGLAQRLTALALTVVASGAMAVAVAALHRLSTPPEGGSLSSGEGFLAALIATLDIGIVACDEAGRVTITNDAAARLLPDELSALHQALDGAVVRDLEIEVGDRTLLVHGTPISTADRHIDGAVVALQDITQRKRDEETLAHLATHDPLTGLANRRLLVSELQQAAIAPGTGGGASLLFVDLDGFKAVNDVLGHDRGDRMLIDVAEQISGAVHHGDVAARMGGDEFVVLCAHGLDDAAAHELAHGVSMAIVPALQLPEESGVVVTASIGLSRSGASAGADDALRDADAAMYSAKRAGGNRIRQLRRKVPTQDVVV